MFDLSLSTYINIVAIPFLLAISIAKSLPIALKAVANASAYVAELSSITVTDKRLLSIDLRVFGSNVCDIFTPSSSIL